MVNVFPQNLQIAFANEAAFPNPQLVSGLPLYDLSVNALKITDTSTPGGFVPALPEHTLTGEHGPKVTITQTSTDNALAITQVGNASGISIICGPSGGRGMGITQAAAQDGITISKSNTGAGRGLAVLQQGTDPGIAISNSGQGHALSIVNAGGTSSRGINVVQNGSIHGVEIICNNVAATNSMGLAITQNASSNGIRINQYGLGNALDIINTNQAHSVSIISTATPSSGKGIYIAHRGVGAGSAGSGIHVQQYGDTQALYIEKQGTGTSNCIDVINSTGGCALNIATTSSGPASPGVRIQQSGNAEALWVQQTGTASRGAVTVVAAHTSGSLDGVNVTQSNSGSAVKVNLPVDGCDGVYIQKTDTLPPGLASGTCIKVLNSSGATPVVITQAHTGPTNVITITNSGSGYDIQGNAGNWWIDKNGNGNFRGPQQWLTFTWNNTNIAQSTGALGFYPRWATAMTVAQWPGDTRWHSMSVGFATGTGTLSRSACSTDHTDTDNVGDSADGQSIGGHGVSVFSYATNHPVRFVVQAWSASGITIQPILTSSGVPQNINATMHLLVMG